MIRYKAVAFVFAVATMLFVPARSVAQNDDKAKQEGRSADKITPVKLQVVLTEYDGDKKVKSLPYTSYVNAYDSSKNYAAHGTAKLRIGSRVPVYTGGKDQGSMQYVDVGTNIDAQAARSDEGSFRIALVVERSWVDSDVMVPIAKSANEDKVEGGGSFKEPVIRQFKTEVEVVLRDGQKTETTVATDPLSGKVLKIEVSLVVPK